MSPPDLLMKWNAKQSIGYFPLVGSLLLIAALTVWMPGSVAGDEAVAKPLPLSPPANTVVYLDLGLDAVFSDGAESRSPSLVRELVRQAFLIAARDELGLATRDAWLGSELPGSGDNAPFDVRYVGAGPGRWELLRGFAKHRAVVLETPFSPQQFDTDMAEVVAQMEIASREQYVAALKQAGFQQLAAPQAAPQGDARVDALVEQIEHRLVELNLFDQFAALRLAHGGLRQYGESPQLLSALVRGYAQLGLLTELNWHPAHKVFKARALLYSQRLVGRRRRSSAALEMRAFAEALAGLHAAALASLAEADRLAAARGPAEPPPERTPWAPILTAYANFDDAALLRLAANEGTGFVPTLLRFLTLEQSGRETLAIESGLESLPLLADCPRLTEGVSRLAGAGLGHSVTEDCPRQFAGALHSRLDTLPDAPPAALRSLRSRRSNDDLDPDDGGLGIDWHSIAKVIRALLEEGRCASPHARPALQSAPAKSDPRAARSDAEPRWETLGILLREAAWTQIWRRADFNRNAIWLSADPWIEATRPVASLHPYKIFLDAFASKSDERAAALSTLSKLNPRGLELQAGAMGLALAPFNRERGCELLRLALRHGDDTAPEIYQRLLWADVPDGIDSPQDRVRWARRLLAVSPSSPKAQACLVANDSQEYRDRRASWEAAAERRPLVALALGQHYARLSAADGTIHGDKRPASNNREKAEHFLRMAAKQSRGQHAYQELADYYLEQGLQGRWLSTLEEFLDQPEFGFEHAQVRLRIYQQYVAMGDWVSAKPYAEEAAESYAPWALQAAAECNEALRDWERAEELYSAQSNRYPGQEFDWYFYIQRTGEGRVEEAEALAAKYAEELNESREPPPAALATYDLLAGKPQQALGLYRAFAAKASDALFEMHLALLAEQMDESKERDEALNRIATKAKQTGSAAEASRPELIALAAALQNDLAKADPAEIDDVSLLSRLAKPPSSAEICDFYYFLGKHYEHRQRLNRAIDAWKKCMTCPTLQRATRTLAGAELAELGIGADAYPNPFAPPARVVPDVQSETP